jgi:glutamate-1-semialdehyde 2,1-aminomutase
MGLALLGGLLREKSKQLFERAKQVIPGGVNSPVRAFKAVGGNPLFIARGAGCRIVDVDGSEYIDYVGSWGPLILGHCHPEVIEALVQVLKIGTSFGAPTEREVELAELICEAYPSIEAVRLTNSGTESTMAAVRLARGFTGRPLILKFEGCYHGHGDSFLVKAGSGVATLGLPDSPGVPLALAELTLTCPFNDLSSVQETFVRQGQQIAAVIVEPVVGNMGCVPPLPGFLEGLRQITVENRSLLIFDEVMTGFRVAYGGAQGFYGIRPDLTTLGKVIGGGLPVGAYGGRKDVMDYVAPVGPVYQAGTLSGNPLAITAGITTLRILRRPGTYESLERLSQALSEGMVVAARETGVPVWANRVGSMFTLFFTRARPGLQVESTPHGEGVPVHDWHSAKRSDTRKYALFFQEMLEHGIYLAPSQFEAGFVSMAHTEGDIEQTVKAARESFVVVAQSA